MSLKRLSAKKKIYIFIYTGQTRFLREQEQEQDPPAEDIPWSGVVGAELGLTPLPPETTQEHSHATHPH